MEYHRLYMPCLDLIFKRCSFGRLKAYMRKERESSHVLFRSQRPRYRFSFTYFPSFSFALPKLWFKNKVKDKKDGNTKNQIVKLEPILPFLNDSKHNVKSFWLTIITTKKVKWRTQKKLATGTSYATAKHFKRIRFTSIMHLII